LCYFFNAIRLEAATSRLEDLAVANTENFREAHAAHRNSQTPSLSKEQTPQFNTGVFTPDARSSIVEEAIVEEEKSPIILDYEKLINDLVDPWVAKSEKIGPVVHEQVVTGRQTGTYLRLKLCSIFFKYNLCFSRSCLKHNNLPLLRYSPSPIAIDVGFS